MTRTKIVSALDTVKAIVGIRPHASAEASPHGPAMPPWTLWIDGQEGGEGQALLLLSVIHLASGSLSRMRLVAVNTEEGVLDAALEVLHHDTGLEVEVSTGWPNDQAPAGRLIYIALRREVGDEFSRQLGALAARGVLLLVATQSAAASPLRHLLLPEVYGFDTRLFASLLSCLAREIAGKDSVSRQSVERCRRGLEGPS